MPCLAASCLFLASSIFHKITPEGHALEPPSWYHNGTLFDPYFQQQQQEPAKPRGCLNQLLHYRQDFSRSPQLVETWWFLTAEETNAPPGQSWTEYFQGLIYQVVGVYRIRYLLCLCSLLLSRFSNLPRLKANRSKQPKLSAEYIANLTEHPPLPV